MWVVSTQSSLELVELLGGYRYYRSVEEAVVTVCDHIHVVCYRICKNDQS